MTLFLYSFGYPAKRASQKFSSYIFVVVSYRIIGKRIFSLTKKGRYKLSYNLCSSRSFPNRSRRGRSSSYFLFFIAESLENYAEKRTKKSIASLLETAPDTAIVKEKEEKFEVEVKDFKSITGKGIKGEIEDRIYYVGNKKSFPEE